MNTEKMNIFDLLKNLWPFVKPYRWLIIATVTLTFVGSLMAQVNAVVLDKTVDAIYHKCRAVGQGGGVGIYHLLPTIFWSEVAHLGEPRFVVAGNRQDTDLPYGVLLGRGQRYG